jgi:hypothetical protein
VPGCHHRIAWLDRSLAPFGRSPSMKWARPRSPLEPLLGRPPRSLHSGDHDKRAKRLRNPFSREPLPPRPGRVAARRDRAASPANCVDRAALRATGLRWDPSWHRWHGTSTADWVRDLRERLGLEVRDRCLGAVPRPGPAEAPVAPCSLVGGAHEGAETAPSHEVGRTSTSGWLDFNAGQLGSAWSNFSHHPKKGKTASLRSLEDTQSRCHLRRFCHLSL